MSVARLGLLLLLFAMCACTRRARVVYVDVVEPAPSVGGIVVVEAPSASSPSGGEQTTPGGPAPSTSLSSAACAPPPSFALTDCRYTCEVEPGTGTSTCRGAVSTLQTDGAAMTLSADLHGAHALLVQVEACEPQGWMFHITDSRTGNGWGGDSGTSTNDAELHVNGSTTSASTAVYLSDDRPAGQEPLLATDASTYVSSSCAVRTFYVADGHVAIDDGFSVCSPALLRIDPPSDRAASPDAMFWIGVHRTVGDAGRSGSGIRRATFCVR